MITPTDYDFRLVGSIELRVGGKSVGYKFPMPKVLSRSVEDTADYILTSIVDTTQSEFRLAIIRALEAADK